MFSIALTLSWHSGVKSTKFNHDLWDLTSNLTLKKSISTLFQSMGWRNPWYTTWKTLTWASLTLQIPIAVVCICVPEMYAALVSSFVLQIVSTNAVMSFIWWFLNICLYYLLTSVEKIARYKCFCHKNYSILYICKININIIIKLKMSISQ